MCRPCVSKCDTRIFPDVTKRKKKRGGTVLKLSSKETSAMLLLNSKHSVYKCI